MRALLISFALLIVVVARAFLVSAGIEVEFRPIPPGPDLEDAIELFGRVLQPSDYDTRYRYRNGAPFDDRELGDTVDIFVRDWVHAAKYRLNDNSQEEWWFFDIDDPWFCGTAGCHVELARKRGRTFEPKCSIGVLDGPLVITDRVTVNGFHEVDSDVEHIYWHGQKCFVDNDEQDEDAKAFRETKPSRDPLRK